MLPITNIEQAAQALSATLSKQTIEKVAGAVIGHRIPIKQLIDLSFDGAKQTGWRAAWALEIISTNHFCEFTSEISYFLVRFPQVTNPGARRHYAKILRGILYRYSRYPRESEQFWNSNLEPIVEACFDWLINPSERVAVKAHCMDCLYYLSDKYPWISEELAPVLQNLQNRSTPGILSRAKKIIQKQARQNL